MSTTHVGTNVSAPQPVFLNFIMGRVTQSPDIVRRQVVTAGVRSKYGSQLCVASSSNELCVCVCVCIILAVVTGWLAAITVAYQFALLST